MELRHTLAVRITGPELALVRRAARAESQRVGEYVRNLLRRDGERLLGAAQLRTILGASRSVQPAARAGAVMPKPR
jgi:hypothetical protein